ncbi:MAG: hypothetical protein HY885_17185 [Deltaproteobacteria bacterium]|nr:hypothetical protein [Deltaproteobacteria bacterium]
MSDIIEFKEKIAKDRSSAFVSFESLLPGKKNGAAPPDTLDGLEKQKDQVRREIEAMLAKAKAEKKRIEEEAFQQGFAKGEEEGRQTGRQAFADDINKAQQLIASLRQERDRVCRQYQEEILVLIKTMVERLVGHEVSVNPLLIKNCLSRAMQYVVDDSAVKVHLHADDFQRIRELSLEDPSFLQSSRSVELIEDPAVAPGGCLLRTDFGEIDARLENCREKLFEIVERAFLEALAADGKE